MLLLCAALFIVPKRYSELETLRAKGEDVPEEDHLAATQALPLAVLDPLAEPDQPQVEVVRWKHFHEHKQVRSEELHARI